MTAWLRHPITFGMWPATCAVIGFLIAGTIFLYLRLQLARVDAIERLCVSDNRHQQDNIDFIVKDLHNPQLAVKAKARFRKVPDCHAYARQTANQPPPQPLTP